MFINRDFDIKGVVIERNWAFIDTGMIFGGRA